VYRRARLRLPLYRLHTLGYRCIVQRDGDAQRRHRPLLTVWRVLRVIDEGDDNDDNDDDDANGDGNNAQGEAATTTTTTNTDTAISDDTSKSSFTSTSASYKHNDGRGKGTAVAGAVAWASLYELPRGGVDNASSGRLIAAVTAVVPRPVPVASSSASPQQPEYAIQPIDWNHKFVLPSSASKRKAGGGGRDRVPTMPVVQQMVAERLHPVTSPVTASAAPAAAAATTTTADATKVCCIM
jgi:hypothetical protein